MLTLDRLQAHPLSDGHRAKFLPSVAGLGYDCIRFEGRLESVRYGARIKFIGLSMM